MIKSELCWKHLPYIDDSAAKEKILCTYATIEDTFPQLDCSSALISVGRGELIGIASWHNDEIPEVYVRIQTFLTWIKTVINE